MDKITVYRDLAFNPIVELLLLFCSVEWLQTTKRSDNVTPLLPETAGNFLEIIGCLSVMLQQISPLVPLVTDAASSAIDAAKVLVPIATAAAAGSTIPGLPPPP